MDKVIFSVILPIYNEEENLKTCITSIFDSSLSQSKYEVIAIDNGSSDESPNIIRKFEKINFLAAPNCNVGEVRNIGARKASGDYIIFIDSDCTISPFWLEQKLALIKKYPKTVFGGGILLPKNPTWIEKFWILQSRNCSELPKKLIGASVLVPKSIFFDVHGFNDQVTSGEDSDFHDRLVNKGFTVKLTNEMDVTHLGNAKSASDFVKRQIWHSENYLQEIRSSLKDPVFLLISACIFSFILLLFSIFFLKLPYLIVLNLSFLAIAPAILTWKRIYRTKRYKLRFLHLPALYFLDCLYLMGRAIGLLSPAFTRIKSSREK